MPLKSTPTTWGPVTRGLHWLSAAIVLFALVHGYWMANMLARPQRLPHYQFHSLVLVYFAVLLALRIVWRLSEPSPEAPTGSAAWERTAALLGHLALYGLLIALLVTGYMN